ncbi:hypothetical protein FRB99_004086 [Tulasnella sp. 403]|nr:hypothetical protein FRB99_004086 [Tulasnella sp. 403]
MSRNHQDVYTPPHRRTATSDGTIVAIGRLPRWVSPLEHELFGRSPTFRRWLLARDLFDLHATKRSEQPRDDEVDNAPRECFITLYRNRCYETIDDINHSADGALCGKLRFLDLGCAPGGFSKWLLEINPAAHGVGVSLGEEDHGLAMNFVGWSDDNKDRYTFIEASIKDTNTWELIADSLPDNAICDLVVADTRYRDEATTPRLRHDALRGEKLAQSRRHIARAVHTSQIMLALRHLVGGGTLVVVIPSDTRPHAIAQLLLLQHLFERITPTRYHEIWSQNAYYLVCEGYRAAIAEREGIVKRLQAALSAHADDEEVSFPRVMLPKEVESDSHATGLTEETVRWLLEYYEPIWSDQADAVEKQLRWVQGKRYFGWGTRGNKSGWD